MTPEKLELGCKLERTLRRVKPRISKYGPNWFCIGGKLGKGTCGLSPNSAYKKWVCLHLQSKIK